VVGGLELQRLKPRGFASLMSRLKPRPTKITTRTKENVLDGQKKEGVVNNQRQVFVFEGDALSSLWANPEDKMRNSSSRLSSLLLAVLAISNLLTPAIAQAGVRSQEHQPLGSLSSVGEVYVNNSPAPADSTIFSGDTVRTGTAGTATFTSSTQGTFQILAQSQVAFNGGDQYVAELQSGTVVMSSMRGPQGLNLRLGSFTAVGVTDGEQSTSKIEKAADGTFAVTCLDGSVILVPTTGSNGLLMQAGQTVSISGQGQLSAVKETAPPNPTPGNVQQKKNYTLWILVGAGAAGAAGAAAALGGKHSSSPPVSPAEVSD
jgi:hypothetical protein